MTKLPSPAEVQQSLQEEFELELCMRDYRLLEAHQEGIFGKVCEMVAAGVEIGQIQKWAKRVVGNEPLVVQRVVNAARYERKLQVK